MKETMTHPYTAPRAELRQTHAEASLIAVHKLRAATLEVALAAMVGRSLALEAYDQADELAP